MTTPLSGMYYRYVRCISNEVYIDGISGVQCITGEEEKNVKIRIDYMNKNAVLKV